MLNYRFHFLFALANNIVGHGQCARATYLSDSSKNIYCIAMSAVTVHC